MLTYKQWMLIAGWAFVLGGCAMSLESERPSSSGFPTAQVGVCDVIGNPQAYDRKKIVITGRIVTDYFEFSGISDRSCGNKFLPFSFSDNVPIGNDQLEVLLRSVKSDSISHVVVTAIGTVNYHSGSVPSVTFQVEQFIDPRIMHD